MTGNTTVWAEVTSLEHGHGGSGWGVGTCLWSPTKSRDGAARYEVMRSPRPRDRVLHLVSGYIRETPKKRFLYGSSIVEAAAQIVTSEPPSAGNWKGAGSYYRIDLTAFRELDTKHDMDVVESSMGEVILSDIQDRPKYYPYVPYRDGYRGAQGLYLAKLTHSLSSALLDLCHVKVADYPVADPATTLATTLEFLEGQRAQRESSYFKRNPGLRQAAILKHGMRCRACELSFGEKYGALGEGYIEMHHLNPLAERLGEVSEVTSVDQVVPLCANCHRVVHRRRPALSIDELRAALLRVGD